MLIFIVFFKILPKDGRATMLVQATENILLFGEDQWTYFLLQKWYHPARNAFSTVKLGNNPKNVLSVLIGN